MEFALNVAWLILSAGLVLVCTAYGKPGRHSRRHYVAVAITLACLIAFLFPVISMTDDLNSGAVVAEAGRNKQWLTIGGMFAMVVTAFLATFSAQNSTWADGSILSGTLTVSREPFSFHMSRRPPPAI